MYLFHVTKYATACSSTLVRWDFLYWVQDADGRIQSWLHHKNILWDYRLNIMTRILEFNCKLYTHDWIIFGLVTTQITWIYTGYFSNTISITYTHRIHSAARFLSLLSCELHNYTLTSLTIVNHLPHLRQCPETWICTRKEPQGNYTCKCGRLNLHQAPKAHSQMVHFLIPIFKDFVYTS